MSCLLAKKPQNEENIKEADTVLRVANVTLEISKIGGMVTPSKRGFYLWKAFKKKLLVAMVQTFIVFLISLPLWAVPAARGGASFCNDYWKNTTNAHFCVSSVEEWVYF